MAKDGDAIEFNCTISIGNNQNYSLIDNRIRWYHNTRLLTMIPSPSTSATIIQSDKDLRIRFLDQDRVLQIRNVGREDKGMFVSEKFFFL